VLLALPSFLPMMVPEIRTLRRLTLVVLDPEVEWSGAGPLRSQLGEWTTTAWEVATALSGKR